MKKNLILLALAAFALTSCKVTTKTARTATMPAALHSAMAADLSVAPERIVYTMSPDKKIRRGGLNNVKKAVEQEALSANGNADILVNEEFSITVRKGLFFNKVKTITVSGRPAKYTNFRSLNDSVWANATYLRYGYSNAVEGNPGGVFKNLFKKKK